MIVQINNPSVTVTVVAAEICANNNIDTHKAYYSAATDEFIFAYKDLKVIDFDDAMIQGWISVLHDQPQPIDHRKLLRETLNG